MLRIFPENAITYINVAANNIFVLLLERFRIHKSDINTGKVSCGVANHLLNVCL